MTIEYPGASRAETGVNRLIRLVVDEVAEAKLNVRRITEGDTKRLEFALTGSHVNAKVIVTNRPSTYWEFNRS
ncbi:hypothetical protein [Nocardioides panzhihuensis]|uniref:Uncharacterized protein n=1 Tax=Nocardioides panzhihuensis TaxID=860243 RepID=A0A7Z0IRB3_9ACTN|nr:hypothetical protein [Nocardioides panzhihuensis]NYI76819.1 hypothetical protein [Nocardioides panzhihuensis]